MTPNNNTARIAHMPWSGAGTRIRAGTKGKTMRLTINLIKGLGMAALVYACLVMLFCL